MRTTKSKKPITVVSVCVAAVACAVGAYRFVYLPLRPADARLKSWNGCRVDAVRYDAKRSAALLAAEHDVTASGGSSSISAAIDEYGMDNVIYLSNDISCHAGSQNSSQDGWGSWYAWNPGSARAEHGWIFIDEGY